MIRRISVENWTSHERTELELTKGANIFIGSMGSGKTSILEALCYGLYGKVPKNKKNSKMEDFIRFGKQAAKVEVELTIRGKELRIVRELGKKSSAWMYVDGRLFEQTPSKVSNAVERLTGITYETYVKAVYAEQNDIDAFINLTPNARKEAMDRILGIADLRDMAAKAKRVFNILASKKKEIALALEGEDDQKLREEAANVEREAESLKKVEEESSAKLVKKKTTLENILALLREAEEARDKWLALKEKKNLLEGRLKSEEEKASRREVLKEEDFLKQRKEELMKQMEIAKEEARALERELEQVVKRRAHEEQKMERKRALEKELEKLREKNLLKLEDIAEEGMRKSTEEAERLRERMAILKESMERAKEALSHLSSAKGGRCPTCNTLLGEAEVKSLINRLKEEVEEKKKGLASTKERLRVAVEKKEELEKKLGIIRKLRGKEEMLMKELETLKVEDVSGLKERESSLRKALESVRSRLERVQKEERGISERLKEIEEIKKASERVKEIKAELEQVRAKMDALNHDEKRLEELRMERLKVMSEYKETESALREARARVAELMKRMALLNEKLNRLEAFKARSKKVDSLLKNFSILQQGLEEAQGKRRELLIESLNRAMQNLWSNIYPYEDYSGVSIEAGKDDYKFWLHDGTRKFALESVASGGEKTSFAITLRVALSMILIDKLPWLILDEPTHNLDENAIYSLVEILRKDLPEMIDQFIIVTHDTRLKSADIGKVFVFDRGEGKIDPTNVRVLEG